jgi:hypothetical protein
MASHSVAVTYDGIASWNGAERWVMVIRHANCICFSVGGEIGWCLLLDERCRVNSMFCSFVSAEASCLDGGVTNVTFDLLSFAFAVRGCCSIIHATLVGGGADSCNQWVGCANHCFSFCWVCFETHSFKEIGNYICGSLQCVCINAVYMAVVGIEYCSNDVIEAFGSWLVVPFADHGIDNNIKNGRRCDVTLCCTAFRAERLAVVALLSCDD